MSYYKTCPYCGAHLDPGEVCDCAARIAEDAILKDIRLAIKKAAPGGANTGDDAETQEACDMMHGDYNG